MLFNLLEQTSETFGDKAAWGGFTFILGMVVIFVGMTVLILCVAGFGKIADAIAKKADKKAEEKNKAESVSASETVSESDEEISEEIRVAIIAAVSAYYAESGSKNEFTVKKIKRI